LSAILVERRDCVDLENSSSARPGVKTKIFLQESE